MKSLNRKKSIVLCLLLAGPAVLLVLSPAVWASSLEVLLWNKLGSDAEVTNSEIGPDGLIIGEINYLPGKFGNGFKPEVRTGDRNIPDNYIRFDGLNLGQKGCIEFWFQPDWVGGYSHCRCILSYGKPGSIYLIQLGYNDWQNRFYLGLLDPDLGGYDSVYRGLVPASTPEWSTTEPFHVAIVWDGTAANNADKVKLFLNGIERGTQLWGRGSPTFVDWGSGNNLYLATRYAPGDWDRHHWEGSDGIMDNIKVWDYPKTNFEDRFLEDSGDVDNDGIANDEDNCPTVYNPDQNDTDVDGIGNTCDNCPSVYNPDQNDTDVDGIGNVCDTCPNDPENDADADTVCGDVDNCPYVYNPGQVDVRPAGGDGIGDDCQKDFDGDGVNDNADNCPDTYNPDQNDTDGDLRGNACDLCPDDPNDACVDVNTVIGPEGGTATNAAGTASVDIPPNALTEETTISIIGETDISNYAIGRSADNLEIGYIYTFEPNGLTFAVPITITLTYEQDNIPGQDCTDPNCTGCKGVEPKLDIYYYDDVNGWEPQGVTQDCAFNTLTLEVDHFSTHVIIAIRDSDGDDVIDTEDNCPAVYNPEQADFDSDGLGDLCDPDDDNDEVLDVDDLCPFEDATGFDADGDGCIDTLTGLQQIIDTLPDDVLSDEIKNSLVSKIGNAFRSVDKEKDEAAINILGAFVNQVEAQRGKKISEEVADMLLVYALNVIGQIVAG